MKETQRDPERLRHILEAITNIETYANGISLQHIESNPMLRHALTWNIMIIGEAANKLSKEFCAAHPLTPWRAVTGMRNVLVHDYYQIDNEELWIVVHRDIPSLKKQIQTYLDEF